MPTPDDFGSFDHVSESKIALEVSRQEASNENTDMINCTTISLVAFLGIGILARSLIKEIMSKVTPKK